MIAIVTGEYIDHGRQFWFYLGGGEAPLTLLCILINILGLYLVVHIRNEYNTLYLHREQMPSFYTQLFPEIDNTTEFVNSLIFFCIM